MATVARPLAVVTGASSGIGFALARQFAQHGYDLVICAEQARIDGAAEELRAFGGRVQPVQANLATAGGCAALIGAVDELARPLEAIALNAGVGTSGQFADETSADEELNVIELNCVGTVRLAKWAARRMVQQGRGRILVTASIAGIMPTPLEAVYGASKAFTLSFASSLHHELAERGVVVTAMLPGPTDTEFFARAHMADTKIAAEKAKENDPADVARMGYDALMAGKERVVAGNFSVKMQGILARFMPEGVKAGLHKKLSEHGSAKA